VYVNPENKTTSVKTPITTHINTAPKPAPTSVPATPTPTPIPVPVARGKYKDGTYQGSSEYAYTGTLQVKAIITGGKLSNVTYAPNMEGPGRSQQIYNYSMPILKSEAIVAQSANVDAVSGASYDSDAFSKSLATALAQAKI
jgi:uncharacterized protein with FMN-binding domain